MPSLYIIYREGTEEYVWDNYEESVPMSTYLVAFVVSKFANEVSSQTDNNVMFRIWARKDALDPRSEPVHYGLRTMGAMSLSVSDGNFNLGHQLECYRAQGSLSAALFPYSVFQFL